MGLLATLLKDMNTLNPVMLTENNFAEIKKAIVNSLALIPPSQQPAALQTSGKTSTETYKLANIRKFLQEALSDADLNSLCMDHFEKAFNNFTDGQNRLQKINQLLGYCKNNIKFNELLNAMQEANGPQFEIYKPYV